MLFSYPEIATIAGVQGVIVYALASALPLFVFAALGPIIRRKCPEGFVLTEWTRQRYGIVAALFLGFMTLVTLFLYMVAELSAVGQVVNALTGLNGLPVMIVQCAITTIYTSLGGFRISFITDNIQGAMVLGLILIASIAIGVQVDIDTSLIEPSGLLKPSLLGWQLLYILPIAILTNDFFLVRLTNFGLISRNTSLIPLSVIGQLLAPCLCLQDRQGSLDRYQHCFELYSVHHHAGWLHWSDLGLGRPLARLGPREPRAGIDRLFRSARAAAQLGGRLCARHGRHPEHGCLRLAPVGHGLVGFQRHLP